MYHVADQSLWLDEGVSMLHAKAIVEHGYPLLPNGRVSWDSFPVHYLMAMGLLTLHELHFAGRLLAVLAGSASIPLMFALCRTFSGSRTHGLVAALLMTFATVEIAWSRQARIYPFLQVFILAGMLGAYRFAKARRMRDLCGSLTCMVLAILTHRAGYCVALFMALLAITTVPVQWRKLPSMRRSFAGRIGLALVLIGASIGVVLWVPSHSNLLDALGRIFSPSPINYTMDYTSYLIQELGLLLPMSILGMLVALWVWPRKAVPLVASGLVYFAVITMGWRYFAFRYSFPLVAPLLAFAALPIALPFIGHGGCRWPRLTWAMSCAVLLLIAVLSAKMVFIPRARYTLGFTAPQPEWQDAYGLIIEREKRLQGPTPTPQKLTTISAIPLFHDLYLGQEVTQKYYLPISFTGYPGDIAESDSYTSATVIHSLQELLSIKGYLILDDFGLRMLVDQEIRQYLASKTPNAILKHEFNVFIWVLDGTGKP